MAKHTPGNWQISQKTRYTVISDQPIESDYIAGSGDIEAYGGYLIAESVAPENLPLIAAAPDLLEAAEAAAAYIGGIHPDACATNPTYLSGADAVGPCDCFVGQLDAAIARAKGEA